MPKQTRTLGGRRADKSRESIYQFWTMVANIILMNSSLLSLEEVMIRSSPRQLRGFFFAPHCSTPSRQKGAGGSGSIKVLSRACVGPQLGQNTELNDSLTGLIITSDISQGNLCKHTKLTSVSFLYKGYRDLQTNPLLPFPFYPANFFRSAIFMIPKSYTKPGP